MEKDLENRIKKIEKRNKIVEKNKQWEISLFRKITITALTYLIITLFLYTLNLPKPFINAIIPTIGFILSTLSLKILRKIWEIYN